MALKKYRVAFNEELKPLIKNLKSLPLNTQKSLLEKAIESVSSNDQENISFDSNESEATLSSSVSTRIKSLDDLIDNCNIDLDEWEVERHIINKWEVGSKNSDGTIVVEPLFQVKAFLKKKSLIFNRDRFRQDLIDDINSIAPFIPSNIEDTELEHPCLLEICAFDLHWGKLAWAEETGDNYDTKIAKTRFFDAIDKLLARASSFNIERIVFPIGNDFFNSDYSHPYSRTTAGTPQEEDLRWQKTFREGRKLLFEGIERLRQFAPVDVVVVPGNHDFERSFYLGDSLEGWYSHVQDVTVNNDASTRKYYKYGECLIGYTHGDNEKVADLPMLMAVEKSKEWAETKYREFHLGHFHSKKEIKYQSTKETAGVVLRWMRSLSGTDSWHAKKGYKGAIQSAEAFVWKKDEGIVGNFAVNL